MIGQAELDRGSPFTRRDYTLDELADARTFQADAKLRASVGLYVGRELRDPPRGCGPLLKRRTLAAAIEAGQLPTLARDAIRMALEARAKSEAALLGFSLPGHSLSYSTEDDTVSIFSEGGLDPRVEGVAARFGSRPEGGAVRLLVSHFSRLRSTLDDDETKNKTRRGR